MTDLSIFASSGEVIGLAVGIPVLVVAGAATALLRLRRGGGGDGAAPTAPDRTRPAPSRPTSSGPAPARPAPEVARPPSAAGVPAPAAPPETPAPTEPQPVPEVEVEVAEPQGEVEVEAEPATYRGRLGKARGLLAGYFGSVRSKGKVDAETWDDLEEALIRADVGVGATDAMLDDLRGRVKAGEIKDADALIEALKADLVETLSAPGAELARPGARADGAAPAPAGDGDGGAAGGVAEGTTEVWLFVGVNGVGKTTTVGKVANRLSGEGTRVLLAAGDTFRAAAAEQLGMWASRADADIVRGAEGGDPSAVVFDAVQRASSRGYDVVLADTAGRLHNKVNLVEELKKIRRVADRPPGHVVEVLLVLDATTGQNGLAQAKVFTEAVDVTGVVLTKLDGTAKGGIVVAIQRELGVPVKLVGLGEGIGDLVDFDPAAFVDALF